MSLMERLERLNLVDGQLRGLSVRVEKATNFHRAQTKQLDLERNRTEEAKANLLQVKAAYGVGETEAKSARAIVVAYVGRGPRIGDMAGNLELSSEVEGSSRSIF